MIALRPMTEAEFQSYLEPAIADYAQEHVKGGRWTEEEALEESRKEYNGLLPNGIATPNQYLYTLVDPERQQNVGMLWVAIRQKPDQCEAFVYDVRIDEAFQRHGYGSQAFRELEHKVRELGASKIALHVFGHNHAAREMYKKLGYEETNVMMAKDLAS